MSSRSVVQHVTEPIVRLEPDGTVSSEADDAAFLSSGYGLTPDGWQLAVLRDWMGLRADERWTATTCGLAVPRQNGKNAILEMRELFGMVQVGEKFLHTAHQVKTARKAFLRILGFFENRRKYPELVELVKEIRKTNGQEAIVLENGGSIEFVARSKGSARGFTVDVLVCDEAQDLGDEALQALVPTVSAAPLGNPQKIFTGTPPSHLQDGDAWLGIRKSALEGKARIAWTDFGCAGQLPNLEDDAEVLRHNPGLETGRLLWETVEDERVMFANDPEGFARERFGWWGFDDEDVDGAFPAGSWAACRVEADRLPRRGLVLGLAVSIDRAFASVGVAASRAGRLWVGPNDRRRGTSWAVDHLRRVCRKHGAPVVVDGRGPAAVLIPDLEAYGLQVVVASTNDVLDGCAGMFDRVSQRLIAHLGFEELDEAVEGATKRNVGDRWAWGRRTSSTDVSMLEAVTLAQWLVAKRDDDYDVLDSVY